MFRLSGWSVSRPVFPVLGLAALFALPVALVVPQGPPRYEAVRDWPERRQLGVIADYGEIDITGVAVGRDGRVYMCQGKPSKHRVLVFDRDGNFLESWKTKVLVEPHSCRIDAAGNVWFTDFYTNQVSKFSPDGQLLGLYGERGRGRRDSRHFKGPNDLAFAPNGDIYVAEGDGDRIVHLSPEGQYLGQWGRAGRRPGLVKFPHSIAVDAQGRVYVADRLNRRIQVFAPDGTYLTKWPRIGDPFSIFISHEQQLYVTDGRRNHISVYDLNGRLLTRFGDYGRRPGELRQPHGICVDTDGSVYVAEASGKRVQKFVRR